jgi:hypothetical protein
MSVDPQQEWNRLSEHYRNFSDEELLELAEESDSLTEIAAQILKAEITLRGLKPASSAENVKSKEQATAAEVPLSSGDGDTFVVNGMTGVRRFRDPSEALLAKSLLESAGIECHLGDENMVRMDWFISNLIGGVKLWVKAEDREAAMEILNQPIPEGFEVEDDEYFEQPRCPKCKSIDVTYEALNKPASYASALVGVPIPFPRDAFKCNSCGAEWQEIPDQQDASADEATEHEKPQP